METSSNTNSRNIKQDFALAGGVIVGVIVANRIIEKWNVKKKGATALIFIISAASGYAVVNMYQNQRKKN